MKMYKVDDFLYCCWKMFLSTLPFALWFIAFFIVALAWFLVMFGRVL